MFSKTLKFIKPTTKVVHFTKNLISQQHKLFSTRPTRVLITGSLGQIGSELVDALRSKFGRDNVIASDVKVPDVEFLQKGPFVFMDATNGEALHQFVKREEITWIIHNAAFLSAVAERNLPAALKLNTEGLHNILECARQNKCKVLVPSSIAAFGPTTPLDNTPNTTIQRPTGIYGIGKVYAEMLGEYYYNKLGVDFRSLRYPGIISWKTLPGGGTTDYSVEMFYYAIEGKPYECFLAPDAKSRLPMMYMPDCIKATIGLLEAPDERLKNRVYNVTAFNITPKDLEIAIKKYIPDFQVTYKPDPLRQGFAESWPKSLDDSEARKDWDWKEDFDLDKMCVDMIENLSKVLKKK
jgi:threonine 3-dehydrogenase